MAEQETDQDLWRRLRQGDAEAFGGLFDRHADALLNYCRHRLADRTEAEDLVSQVFLEAWRARDRLEVPGPTALPLLYGIAANLCANRRRTLGRAARAHTRIRMARTDEEDPVERVASRVDAERDVRRLRGVLDGLSPERRAVVDLCLVGGLDTRSAALALGVPEGTVKSRLSRARAQIAERFAVPTQELR